MSGGLSIDSLGYNYNNLYNDPAFWAAVSSPNVNQLAFQKSANNNMQTQTQSQTVPVGRTQVTQTQPEKKNNTWKWLFAGAAVVAGGYALYKKGDGSIIEGAKKLIGKGTEKAAEKGIQVATSNAGKATLQTVNGKNVVTLSSGEKNIISAVKDGCSERTANAKLAQIGEKVKYGNIADRFAPKGKTPYRLAEGNELKSFVMEHRVLNNCSTKGLKGKDLTVIWSGKGDTVTICTGKAGKLKDITTEVSCDEKLYNTIMDRVSGYKNGTKNLNELKQAIIRNTDAKTGLVSTIKSEKGTEKLLSSVTDRWALNSDRVRIARYKDSTLDKALKLFETKNGKGLNVLQRTVELKGAKFTLDREGNIISVVNEHGEVLKPDTDRFILFCQRSEASVKNAPKVKENRWLDKIYELVA